MVREYVLMRCSLANQEEPIDGDEVAGLGDMKAEVCGSEAMQQGDGCALRQSSSMYISTIEQGLQCSAMCLCVPSSATSVFIGAGIPVFSVMYNFSSPSNQHLQHCDPIARVVSPCDHAESQTH